MGILGDESRHTNRRRARRRALSITALALSATVVLASPTWAAPTPDASTTSTVGAPASAPATTAPPTDPAPTSPAPSSPAPSSPAPTSPSPSDAAPTDPAPSPSPSVTLTDPAPAEVGRTVTLRGALAGIDPSTATVVVERRSGSTWAEVGRPTAGADSAFSQAVTASAGSTTYRVRVLVDGAEVATDSTVLKGVAARIVGTLSMPRAARDLSVVKAAITIRRAHDRKALRQSGTLQFRRKGHRSWTNAARWRTSTSGTVTVRLRPRHDGSYRLGVAATSTTKILHTSPRSFDNRPTGSVVRLPKGAPRPRLSLPPQHRPSKAGAQVRIGSIDATTWRSMQGRSWHRGCPVGRSGLRVVRTSYWAYDGYVRRGEIVVNASVARSVAGIFGDLYRAKVPIRAMYRVDRFGWNPGLQGADDYRSMAAGNTSGFNCRRVVGSPQLTSPHTYGTAIDINTWENPYRSARGYTPNSWWQSRSTPANITWRGANDPVVRIFNRHGFRWLGAADLHHFER